MKGVRGRGFLLVAAVAGSACAWFACDDSPRSHVYTGRQYEPQHYCLGDLQSIDVVEGAQPNTPCAPICIVSEPLEGGVAVAYVSTMCPPYPIFPYDSDAGSTALCEAALLANTYDTTCEDDGAIINVPPEAGEAGGDGGDAGDAGEPDATTADAEADATTGVDAGSDAGNDATVVDAGSDATGDAATDAAIDSASE